MTTERKITIEMIESAWAQDSIIDKTKLVDDSANQYKLHSKYHKILNVIRARLRKLQAEKTRLNLLKTDYYSNQLPPQQLKELGWEPNRRVILKGDISNFVEADEAIININLEIGECHDLISFLDSIIKSINQRQFTIKNIIEQNRFTHGLN